MKRHHSESVFIRRKIEKLNFNIHVSSRGSSVSITGVMDQIVVASGKPLFIEEIIAGDASLAGSAINVTGKLCEHWVDTCTAKLCDPQSKKELVINTALIEPFEAKFGSLFQMIGELESGTGQSGDLQLKARVVRCVDGLDLARYRRAIECQRTYLAKRQR